MAFDSSTLKKVAKETSINSTIQNKEMETVILSLLIRFSDKTQDVILNELSSYDFTSVSYLKTFEICKYLYENSIRIDKSMILDLAQSRNLDTVDETFLNSLFFKECNLNNLEFYVSNLKDKSNDRRLLSLSKEIDNIVHTSESDYQTKLAVVNSSLDLINNKLDVKQVIDINTAFENFVLDIDRRKSLPIMKYKFRELDNLLYSIEPGLIILGARPSMGKSAYTFQIAEHLSQQDYKTVIISLEMSASEIVKRMIKSRVDISEEDLRNGNVSTNQKNMIREAGKEFNNNIFIDETSGTDINKIKMIAKSYHRKGLLNCLIIDYLQLVTNSKKTMNRYEEVSSISRELKQLSRELNIPIFALCQLNRDLESRVDKRPLMSDLRESGQIEQDADVIMFLHREDYYSDDENIKKQNKVQTEVIVRKNRNGNTGLVRLFFEKNKTMFSDYNQSGNYQVSKPNYYNPCSFDKDDVVEDSPFDGDNGVGNLVPKKKGFVVKK